MPITVVTPASSRALTTAENFKAEIGLSGSSEDTYITNAILRASAMITAYCGREFVKEAVKETVAGYGWDLLMVSRTPITTLTAIRFGNDLVTVSASEYSLYDASAGLIRRLYGWWDNTASQSFGILPTPRAGTERALYEVEYTGGYISPAMSGTRDLPYDIEMACIELVKSLYYSRKNNPNVASESVPDVGSVTYRGDGVEGSGGMIPAAVASTLLPWRRIA